MSDDSLYLMSPMEIALGYVFGHMGALQEPSDVTVSPRHALERVIHNALLRPPCGIAFSGGRDSSVVLAVATHVARREGLPDPIPITRVFPDAPTTDESDWQEMVVRHLRLDEWHRLVLHHELDVIGPLATTHLVQYGVVWPPTIHVYHPMVETLRGGSLLDGEGGDEVLGVEAHRIGRVSRLVRTPRSLRWKRVRAALVTVAPGTIRASRVRNRWAQQHVDYLRPVAREALVAGDVRRELAQPISFSKSVRMVPLRRSQALFARNLRILYQQYDVDISSPLIHHDVVDALARDGGRFGSGDRTDVLRALVPDLLPDAIMSRTSKTWFNAAYFSRQAREFAGNWEGNGVDTALVDPSELRREWLSEMPSALSTALLQAAWLGTDRPRH